MYRITGVIVKVFKFEGENSVKMCQTFKLDQDLFYSSICYFIYLDKFTDFITTLDNYMSILTWLLTSNTQDINTVV